MCSMLVTLLDVPRTDVLIERRIVVEHGVHGCDAADVPRTDVLIERAASGAVEQVGHVSDTTGACG